MLYSPLRLVRKLLLRSHVELLLLRPGRIGRIGGGGVDRAVGPPAVGGAVAGAAGGAAAGRARPGADGGALLLQLEHRLAAVRLRSLKTFFTLAEQIEIKLWDGLKSKMIYIRCGYCI